MILLSTYQLLMIFPRRKRGRRLPSAGRGQVGDKSGKGLRHFSMKVCEKVQQKGTTSYNEVGVLLSNNTLLHMNLNFSEESQHLFDRM